MITAYHNLHLISDGFITRGKAILINGDKITDIVDDNVIPQSAKKIDLNGANVAPGLIDLQIYGSGGKLFAGTPVVVVLVCLVFVLLCLCSFGFLVFFG